MIARHISAAVDRPFFKGKGNEPDRSCQLRAGQRPRKTEHSRYTARVVVSTRRGAHRVIVSSDNEQRFRKGIARTFRDDIVIRIPAKDERLPGDLIAKRDELFRDILCRALQLIVVPIRTGPDIAGKPAHDLLKITSEIHEQRLS